MQTWFDNTVVSAQAKCDRMARIRHGFGLVAKETRAELLAGQAAHTALATFYETSDPQRALVDFDEQYREWAERYVNPDDRLAWPNVHKIMAHWLRTHPVAMLPYQPVGPEYVEVAVRLQLAPQIEMIALVDLLATVGGRAYVVVEHKTTGRVNESWIDQWHSAAQLTGYYAAVEERLGVPICGVYVNAIEFSKVPSDPKRKCKEHNNVPYVECGILHPVLRLLGPYTRSPEQVAEWRENFLLLAEQYQRVAEDTPQLIDIGMTATQGKFTGACRWCEFRKPVCEGPLQPELLGRTLVESRWDPRVLARRVM